MSVKNKKIIIGVIIALILIIIALIIFNKNRNKNKEQENLQIVELSELLEIKNVEDCKYKTEKTQEEISSKYIATEKKEVKAKVKAGEIEGKMIYVRGNYDNVNIYKNEYKINKYEDKTAQVSNILQQFEMICEQYMDMSEEYEETEQLYGENSAKFELPLEESIYNEERLYSKTYKSEEKQYEINFYKNGENIVCELVKVLQ